MSRSRAPPQEYNYYAMTGGSRAVNLPFEKPKQTRAVTPKPVPGGPLRTYAPGSRVYYDGTIMPAPGPSRWAQAAAQRRAATAEPLVSLATLASEDPAAAAPPAAAPGKRRDGSKHFSTEYSRSFTTPVRATPSLPPGMPTPSLPALHAETLVLLRRAGPGRPRALRGHDH